jgi:hypothetical protein
VVAEPERELRRLRQRVITLEAQLRGSTPPRRLPIPSRMPTMVNGQIWLRDLYQAAARIDADAGKEPPQMTATELIEVLSYYVHPPGYTGRGRPRALHSG